MNDLRDRPETAWNALFGLSLVAIIVTGRFYFFGAPTKSSIAEKNRSDLASLEASARQVDIDLGLKMEAVSSKVWHADADALGNQTLATVTSLAEKHGLQLSNFRTE